MCVLATDLWSFRFPSLSFPPLLALDVPTAPNSRPTVRVVVRGFDPDKNLVVSQIAI